MLAVVGVFAMVGCFGSGMESASRRTGENPRSDGVIDVASRDTGCPASELRIVAETGRRYVNETAFRFVLEGCGERLGYLERCELGHAAGAVAVNDSLGCTYLLVTRLSLRAPPAPPAPEPDASVL